MADTREYIALTTISGSAVTGQTILAVPTGEAPETSPRVVSFVEVTRSEGGSTYNTGEYYVDIPTYGLWDFYVKDNNTNANVLYQERRFIGGVDLLSGGLSGFNVYESIRPCPNDTSYTLISFPATGLDANKVLTAVFGNQAIKYDAAYGIVRDMVKGVINMKVNAPVTEGAHLVTFDQGGEVTGAIFRVVDVANSYSSPMYNFMKNPEFANDTDSDSVPDEWSSASYWSDTANAPTVSKVIDPSGSGYTITIVGDDGAGTVFEDNDVVYISQTAYIGDGLTQPQIFTCSVTPNIDIINGASAQMSLTAIARINGADTTLATTSPITFGSSDRAGMKIIAPVGTTHIRVALSIVNKTGSVLPSSGSASYVVKFEKVKLSVGVDSNWYA